METKNVYQVIVITLFFIASLCEATNLPDKGVQEKRTQLLSSGYKLEWQANFDLQTVQFNVTVKTTGYVGFGLSLGGQMTGADIVIGGIFSNGTSYFNDYHGTENGMPHLDKEQNWNLLSAHEEAGFTYLTFSRPFNTCDENEDVDITTGTVKIIWAFGSRDSLSYHSVNSRGALAVNLLDPPIPLLDLSNLNQSHFSVDITLTGEKTVYYCSVHKRRPTASKTHIVAFQPKLETPDALKYTHHFSIFICKAPTGQTGEQFFGPHVGQPPQHCYSDSSQKIYSTCYSTLYFWSTGGRLLVLPKEIGFPWGIEEHEYFMFELHINNPLGEKDITFQSGVNFFDTYELRKEEAGMMSIGHMTSPSLLIPPSANDWLITGHCSSDCTKNIIPETGISLINVNLHAHISARKIKFRHFRNGKEIPWIAKDNTYDFEFQENRPILEEVKVLPGDHMSLECSYNSSWKSPSSAIIGGLQSTDEVCNAFIIYYPRIQHAFCYSEYPLLKIFKRFGIEGVIYENTGFNGDPIVTSPPDLLNRRYSEVVNNTLEWSDKNKSELQEELRFGEHTDVCPMGGVIRMSLFKHFSSTFRTVSYPEIKEEYQEPMLHCHMETSTTDSIDTTTTIITTTTSSTTRSYEISSLITVTLLTVVVIMKP